MKEKSKQHQEAGKKGGEVTGPRRAGYLRDRLEAEVFGTKGRFESWVLENYTDAVKELGKLQPKDIKIAGDENGAPIKHTIERTIVDGRKDTDS